jgi:hypothetical protein
MPPGLIPGREVYQFVVQPASFLAEEAHAGSVSTT